MAALVVGAILLRVWAASRSGLWRDEAQFLWIVRRPAGRILSFLRWHESHPPLFYLVMRAWQGLFGDSETTALALTILLGVVLVPVMYLIAVRLLSPRTGWIAAVLAAFSPTLVRHSALVRPYSLLPLLCLVSVFFLWRALRPDAAPGRAGGRYWALYAASTLALLFTHNWTWLVWGAQGAVSLAVLLLGLAPRKAIRPWLAAQIAVLLGYSVWASALLRQLRGAGYGPSAGFSPLKPLGILAKFAFGLPDSAALAAAALLIAFLAIRQLRRRARETPAAPFLSDGRRLGIVLFLCVPLVATAAAALLSRRTDLLIPWTMVTIAPCLILVTAHGIASVGGPGRGKWAPAALTFLLALAHLVINQRLQGQVKSNAREIAALVAARARPGDLIVIAPEWIASSFNYYFPGREKGAPEQINYPYAGWKGAIHYDNRDLPLLDPGIRASIRARLEGAHRVGRRVWLVVERDGLTDVVNDTDIIPTALVRTRAGALDHLRSIQLYKQLNALYGPGNTTAFPPSRSAGAEILRVFLYGGNGGNGGSP